MPRTLQQRLDSIRAAFAEQAPEAVREIMHRATEALIESGQADRAIGEGDTAPTFALPSSSGEMLRSEELLGRGPLVLTYFRGNW